MIYLRALLFAFGLWGGQEMPVCEMKPNGNEVCLASEEFIDPCSDRSFDYGIEEIAIGGWVVITGVTFYVIKRNEKASDAYDRNRIHEIMKRHNERMSTRLVQQ